MKSCSKCSVVKPLSEFQQYKSGPRKGKYQAECRECRSKRVVSWQKKEKERYKEHYRRGRLKLKYGITPEQYDELLSKQGGTCAICLRPAETFTKRLAIDHNHKTGAIRGLLCTYCNHRVVGRQTDPDVAQKVADYLRQGTGWFVPEKRPKRRRKKRK